MADAFSLKPRMTDDEMACFTRHVRGAPGYLEFGCGGSTLMAGTAGSERIDSVESDLEWIEACKTAPELAPLVEAGRLVFHYADVGPVQDWGKPKGRSRVMDWPSYYLAVWDTLPGLPSVVLVDGRWRVACALQALIHCDAEATILFHDFWIRPQYHGVLAFMDVVERVDTLAVFRRKADIDWRALASAVAKHALDFH